MSDDQIKIDIVGDSKQLVAALKQAADAAKRMDSGISQSFAHVGTSVQNTTKKVESAGDTFKGLKKVGQGLGFQGIINDVEDLAVGFEALGPAGIAAAGALAAVAAEAALAFGIGALAKGVAAIDDVSDSLKSLQDNKVQGFEPLPPKTLEQVERTDAALQLISDTFSQLYVDLMTQFTPTIEDMTEVLAIAAMGFRNVAKEVIDAAGAVVGFVTDAEYVRGILGDWAVQLPIIGDDIQRLADNFEHATKVIRANKEATEAKTKAEAAAKANLKEYQQLEAESVEAIRIATEAREKRAEAARKVAEAEKQLNEILRTATAANGSAIDEAQARYDAEIEKVNELEKASGDHATANKARAALEEQLAQDIEDIHIKNFRDDMDRAQKETDEIIAKNKALKEAAKAQSDFIDGVTSKSLEGMDAIDAAQEADQKRLAEMYEQQIALAGGNAEDIVRIHEAMVEDRAALDDEYTKRREEYDRRVAESMASSTADITGSIATAIGAQVEMIKKRAQTEKEVNGKVSEETKKQLTNVFNAQKAFAVAQSLINTALAISSALTTVPYPAAIAAAAAAGVAGAVQTGMILAQAPPSFAIGGMVPDEVARRGGSRMIQAEPGEGLLTKRGVEAIGGREGVDAANRGRFGGNGSGRIVIVNQYKHRVFDSFIQDSIRKPGPLRNALRGNERVGISGFGVTA